ncbi:hypothetical protein ACFX13_034326 [Malus domestica]
MRRRTRRVDSLVDDDHVDFYHVVVTAGDPVIFQARSQDFYGRLIEQVMKAVGLKPEHLQGATLTVHLDGGVKVQITPEQASFPY